MAHRGASPTRRLDALGLVWEAGQEGSTATPRGSSSLQPIASSSAHPQQNHVHAHVEQKTKPPTLAISTASHPAKTMESPRDRDEQSLYPSSPISDSPYEQASPVNRYRDQEHSPTPPSRGGSSSLASAKRTPRRATHDAAGPSMLPAPEAHVRVSMAIEPQVRQTVPSTTTPTIGRAVSLNDGTSRYHRVMPQGTSHRQRSQSPPESASAILEISTHPQREPYQPLHRSSSLTSSWTNRARAWSSSFHRGRDSTAFALRLAEGASPYLRAGLEELRSIFDVDSVPLPASPFEEDEESEEGDAESAIFNSPTRQLSGAASSSATSIRTGHDNAPSCSPTAAKPTLFTASPVSASPQDASPSAIGDKERHGLVRRQHSREESHGMRHSSTSPDRQGGYDEKKESPSLDRQRYTYNVSTPHREEGSFHRPTTFPTTRRPFVAWSLAAIAVGMTSICVWGYATQSDIFSSTLVGFFLAQPAFALMALVSLFLRKRALMDLSSRAMRAHILAQAIIVVLAYLDLSASSTYTVGLDGAADGSNGRASKQAFRMVPSMQMRFGPLHSPTEAGAIMSETMSASRSGDAASDHAVSSPSFSRSSSFHAHDTHVGDWRSRLTHLVVFLVQGAIPIVLLLVSQYIVAQRLAALARRGTLSRQTSTRSNASTSSRSLSSSGKEGNAHNLSVLQPPSGALAVRRASKSLSGSDFPTPVLRSDAQHEQQQHLSPPSPVMDRTSRRRQHVGARSKRRPNTTDGAGLASNSTLSPPPFFPSASPQQCAASVTVPTA